MWVIQRMPFAYLNRRKLTVLAFVLHFSYIEVNHQVEIKIIFKNIFVYVNFIRWSWTVLQLFFISIKEFCVVFFTWVIHCFLKKFKWFYLFIFRERGREGGERERNMKVWEIHGLVASCTPPSRDLARNPGMRPDWESNRQPLGLQAGIESTEPHQPGQYIYNLKRNFGAS